MTDTDMGGVCSCDIWDDDLPDVYNRKIRKARKQHTCYECWKPIEPGDRYEYVSLLFDGEWGEYHTHLSCAGIRRDFCCNLHGGVSETFQQNYGFSPWEVPNDEDDE